MLVSLSSQIWLQKWTDNCCVQWLISIDNRKNSPHLNHPFSEVKQLNDAELTFVAEISWMRNQLWKYVNYVWGFRQLLLYREGVRLSHCWAPDKEKTGCWTLEQLSDVSACPQIHLSTPRVHRQLQDTSSCYGWQVFCEPGCSVSIREQTTQRHWFCSFSKDTSVRGQEQSNSIKAPHSRWQVH